jgi:hypothetical protein
MRPPCPQNYFVSESILVNRLVHLQIAEVVEIVVSVVAVVGTIVVVAPGAPGIVSSVLVADDYTFVQLILHPPSSKRIHRNLRYLLRSQASWWW